MDVDGPDSFPDPNLTRDPKPRRTLFTVEAKRQHPRLCYVHDPVPTPKAVLEKQGKGGGAPENLPEASSTLGLILYL